MYIYVGSLPPQLDEPVPIELSGETFKVSMTEILREQSLKLFFADHFQTILDCIKADGALVPFILD